MTLRTDSDLAFAEVLEQRGVASSPQAVYPGNVIAFPAELETDENRTAFLNAAAERKFFDLEAFCENVRPPKAIIDGLLYANGVGVIFGQAGIGKSYFVTDLALSVASDAETFHGRALRLRGARVAMLLYEGEYAIPRRIKAWQKARRRQISPDRLLIRYDLPPLHDVEATKQLTRELKALGVDIVIVDTLSAATAGLDEDKARDMGPVISACRDMAREIDGLCLLVAHPPKGASNTVRGSSVIDGNTDNLIAITKAPGGISVKPRKVRAGAPTKPLMLKFKQIDIGEDPDEPGTPLFDSYLTADDHSHGFDECLAELLNNGGKITQKELVDALIEKNICKKSRAYTLIDERLPKDQIVSIGIYEVRRSHRFIKVQEEAE